MLQIFTELEIPMSKPMQAIITCKCIYDFIALFSIKKMGIAKLQQYPIKSNKYY